MTFAFLLFKFLILPSFFLLAVFPFGLDDLGCTISPFVHALLLLIRSLSPFILLSFLLFLVFILNPLNILLLFTFILLFQFNFLHYFLIRIKYFPSCLCLQLLFLMLLLISNFRFFILLIFPFLFSLSKLLLCDIGLGSFIHIPIKFVNFLLDQALML